jgi:molecular chaperone GrpE
MSHDTPDQADVLADTPVDPGDGAEQVPSPPAEAPDAVAEADAPEADPAEPDYKDQWLRAAAELENVRKRARRDVALAEGRGVTRLVRELLPALDNLDRALAAAESQPENADHHLTDGIRLVQREMLAALDRVGIVQDAPHGKAFDPHRHEAVAQQPAEGAEPGTVIEVYQPGYLLGDEVLRAAKVVVAS